MRRFKKSNKKVKNKAVYLLKKRRHSMAPGSVRGTEVKRGLTRALSSASPGPSGRDHPADAAPDLREALGERHRVLRQSVAAGDLQRGAVRPAQPERGRHRAAAAFRRPAQQGRWRKKDVLMSDVARMQHILLKVSQVFTHLLTLLISLSL